MAASGAAAAAALAAPTGALAAPPRQLPYTATLLRRQRAAPLRQPPSASTAPAAASAPSAALRTSKPRTTHGSSLTGTTGRLPLQPGLPIGSNPRGHSVLARYFREGTSSGGPGGDLPPPPSPPAVGPSSDASSSGTDPRVAAGAAGAAGIGAGPAASAAPQGNAVPFIASTWRQRHHSHQQAPERDAAAAARGGSEGGGGEEDEADAGADEEVRRRAQARREAMFLEAERRAVSLHPNVLLEDLAAEATVPYDAAGSLEPPPARDEEGEAAGPPSGGAGPHGGLAVESVDPDTGGFTTSFPAVDPAYDDVGRAIRQEQGPHSHRRHPAGNPLAAEARARKAATAEDLREALLDAAPELQDTYRAFGIPPGVRDLDLDLGRRARGGPAVMSTEEMEALLDAASLGTEGAAMAELLPAAPSELADPLGWSGAAAGGDPLAALDALEHLDMLHRLDSSSLGPTAASTASTASTGSAAADDDDISNVMPSPLLDLPPTIAAAAAADTSTTNNSTPAEASGRPATEGAGHARSGSSRRGLTAPAARRGGRGGGGRHHAAPGPASGYPAVYHTSPDVPDEELEPRGQRRRPARRRVPSASTAAAAARTAWGGVRHHAAEEVADGPAAGPAGGAGSSAGWVSQAALYNTSPDVPDEELERAAAAAAAAARSPADRDENLSPGVAAAVPEELPLGPSAAPRGVEDSSAKVSEETPQPPAPVSATEMMNTGSASARPSPSRAREGDGQRLRSLGDVDRQFIDLDGGGSGGWDEQVRNGRRVAAKKHGRSAAAAAAQQQQRMATQPPGARGVNGSQQQSQTIGVHGTGAGSSGGGGGGGGDGRAVTVLRVECVPSQTYGVARTAAVLAADGKLTLLARPTGPSRERVRAALKLLHMAPDSREFRTSAAAAAAAAADNDERAAAATEAAAIAAAAAAVGTQGMELEAAQRAASSAPSLDEQDLQPGLVLGQSELDPAEVMADPTFPLDDSWTDHHDPHVTPPMMEGEGHMLGLQANMWHEDYDEVMGQIYDGQRSGWSEDAVNGMFDSDVY